MRHTFAAVAAACTIAMTMTAGPAMAHPGSPPSAQGSHHGQTLKHFHPFWHVRPGGHGHGHTNPPKEAVTVATGLAGPMKADFGPKGGYLVAESMAGRLTGISAKGVATTLVNRPGQEIGGVSHANGTTYYVDNDVDPEAEEGSLLLPSRLMSIDSRGTVRQLADLSVFEGRYNPDAKTLYGVRDASPSCLAQAPMFQHTGEVFSHPYATAPARGGVYVADAGANTLLSVDARGHVRLVKALAPEPVTIDAAAAAAIADMGVEVPECMMGHTYYAEAVPTSVAVSGAWLYYTVLPGIPGMVQSAGKAYRMNLHSGRIQLLASGLNMPTGIAVDSRNQVYVSELMGAGVSVIKNGRTSLVLPAMMAADVAVSGNTLLAVTEAMAETGGKLVTLRLR